MKIKYLLFVISNFLFAQSLSITAEQLNESSILVKIKNISSSNEVKLVLDSSNLEYRCNDNDELSNESNFARIAICFNYPRNYNYQDIPVPRRIKEKMYGTKQDLSILDYIRENTIVIKPNEEKKIIYNVSDFNNSLNFSKKKKFIIKSKIIYFGGKINRYLISANFVNNYFTEDIYSKEFNLKINFFRP